MQQRDPYYDILRGIAIIFVIAIHTYTPSSIDIFSISLLFRNICNSAVPIFHFSFDHLINMALAYLLAGGALAYI